MLTGCCSTEKNASLKKLKRLIRPEHCSGNSVEFLLDPSLKKLKRLIRPGLCSGNSVEFLLDQFSRLTSKHSMATRQLTQYKAS
mmetsp:Transcript_86763/g.158431  ORF Transcript_86763/g.158431 Transcript_86763/m.158431 type:complete len:84 (-) Transcript_86763:166-417(-)